MVNNNCAQSFKSYVEQCLVDTSEGKSEKILKKIGLLNPSVKGYLFNQRARRLEREFEKRGYRPALMDLLSMQIKSTISDYLTGKYDLFFVEVSAPTDNIGQMLISEKVKFEYVKRFGHVTKESHKTSENGVTTVHTTESFDGVFFGYEIRNGIFAERQLDGKYNYFVVKLFPKKVKSG